MTVEQMTDDNARPQRLTDDHSRAFCETHLAAVPDEESTLLVTDGHGAYFDLLRVVSPP